MKHVEFYRNDKDGSVLVSVGTQVPEKSSMPARN